MKTAYTITASPNDRLLLGMKGTMSEMELSVWPSVRQPVISDLNQAANRACTTARKKNSSTSPASAASQAKQSGRAISNCGARKRPSRNGAAAPPRKN